MTGNNNTIHFILMGNSREHLLYAINHYSINEMVVFTSENLYNENLEFIQELEKKGIIIADVVKLRPFDIDALRCMSCEMLKAYQRYSTKDINIAAALTGGTNLMVSAMVLFALLKGVQCHYIIKEPENKAIDIALLQELHSLDSLQAIENCLLEGGI